MTGLRAIVLGDPEALVARLAGALATSPAVEDCRVVEGRPTSLAEAGWPSPDPDAAVYVAGAPGPDGLPDAERAGRILGELAGRSLRQVVVVSHAAAVEPRHAHPGMLSEERVPPRTPANPISRRWRQIERTAEKRLRPRGGAVLTVLRPATLAAADRRGPLDGLLEGRFRAAVAGHDPTLQLLDPDDLARAVTAAVERRRGGTFHLAPAGAIPLRKALRVAGVRRVPLPYWVHRLARGLLAPFGRAAPAARLEFLRRPWTVGGETARRELGFEPRRSSGAAALARLSNPTPGQRALAERTWDDFGQDKDYIAAYGRTLFRFLHDAYWRIEVRGLEHVPVSGRAVLTGIHRGFMPWDGVMALHAVARRTGRHPRFMIHPGLVKFPFLANYMTKLGGMIACRENADRVLGEDGIVGMFPEGIRGAFCYYRDAYALMKFGRDEFVRMALRNRAPIVPFVTVGSAEIFPILAKIDWAWWKRYSEWPTFPITPTFPLAPIPLPSKWHTQFLAPLHVEREHPPEAAEDPQVVQRISRQVRSCMEETMRWMVERRKSVFFGSVFPAEAGPGAGGGAS